MTKKDYIALAAALKAVKPPPYTGDKDSMDYMRYVDEHGMWKDCAIAIMNACRVGNPRFDRNKFVAACGVPNVMDP